jgi:RadC-like JAB domain-containing protein
VPTCSTHRRRPLPAVNTPEQALGVLGLATDEGRDRIVALACLDRTRRPLTMFIIEDSAAGADELSVATELLLDALDEADATSDGPSPLGAVILATSRPGEEAEPSPADLDTWDQLERRYRDQGIVLVDWFILADGLAVSVATRAGRPCWPSVG